jgi:hypothetical protein
MAEQMSSGLDAIAHAARGGVARGVAPVHLWNPDRCGDIDIRIAADGQWFHEGAPISRPSLVRLFSTVLRRDPDGVYLVTPGEKLRISVDDAPFVAIDMDRPQPGVLRFVTNVGDVIEAGPANPIRIAAVHGAPKPYLHVRGGLEALIARPVYYDLAEAAVADPDTGRPRVFSNGVWFPLEPEEPK